MEGKQKPSRKLEGLKNKHLGAMISLLISFFLLYLLYRQITIIGNEIEGATLTQLFWLIVISLLLLSVPFIFNPQAITRKLNKIKKRQGDRERTILDLKIARAVKLNNPYKPMIIKKCPKCRFENPGKVRICPNCGYEFSF